MRSERNACAFSKKRSTRSNTEWKNKTNDKEENAVPLEPYRYPDVLYCGKCRKDVDVQLDERTAVYTNNDTGEEMRVAYRAAVCPFCGNTLCERDMDFAFINAITKEGQTDE
jgi:hypothetical protein